MWTRERRRGRERTMIRGYNMPGRSWKRFARTAEINRRKSLLSPLAKPLLGYILFSKIVSRAFDGGGSVGRAISIFEIVGGGRMGPISIELAYMMHNALRRKRFRTIKPVYGLLLVGSVCILECTTWLVVFY